jgi:hypothetical protein
VVTNGRSDDDAVYPVHCANFGITNGVSLQLTAFSPWAPDSVDQMCYPYVFYDILVTNAQPTPVDIAVALQIGTSGALALDAGKGFHDGTHRAVYVSSDDPTMIVSSGNDNGFFTTGVCNNVVSGLTNRTACKVSLAAGQARHVRFVLSWFLKDTRYYYTNRFTNASDVATYGLEKFQSFENNALSIVNRMRASNIPGWMISQTLTSLCNFTNNSIYTADGRYCHTEGQWNINGTGDQMWHARFINTMLFPQLVWQELLYWARTQKINPVGQMHHDFGTPMSKLVAWDDQQHTDYRDIDKWVDLNCAFIISTYEAFIATNDRAKLDLLWPYVQKAAQRILDQAKSLGSPQYPYTFQGSENSYDAGGNPDPFNGSIAIAAFKVMSLLSIVEANSSLSAKFSAIADTAAQSFQKRYLDNNFPSGRICESVLAGQWIGYFLKLGDFWPQANLLYGISELDKYYNPLMSGLGNTGGTYDEWAPYVVAHVAGIFLQTGFTSQWKTVQNDWWDRNFINRDKTFNQTLGIPPKANSPKYLASSIGAFDHYISYPVVWRNYYSVIGYQRNKYTAEQWLTPIIPNELNHTISNAFFISPEGNGSISCTESGTNNQNFTIIFSCDSSLTIDTLYLWDRCGTNVSVTINGATVNVERIGHGFSRLLKIKKHFLAGSHATTIIVTGDPGTPQPKLDGSGIIDSTHIRAAWADTFHSAKTEACSDIGMGSDVGDIVSGSYLVFNSVEFGTGATVCSLRVASDRNGGTIQLRLDSPTGKLIGTATVSPTGGWQKWETITCPISGVTGKQKLYLFLTNANAGTDFLFNLNWFSFNTQSTNVSSGKQCFTNANKQLVSLVGKTLRISVPLSGAYEIDLCDVLGHLVYKMVGNGVKQYTIPMDRFTNKTYIVSVTGGGISVAQMITKL